MPRPFYPPLVEPGVLIKPKGTKENGDDPSEDHPRFTVTDWQRRTFALSRLITASRHPPIPALGCDEEAKKPHPLRLPPRREPGRQLP